MNIINLIAAWPQVHVLYIVIATHNLWANKYIVTIYKLELAS